MRWPLLFLALALPVAAEESASLNYRFDQVRSKVVLITAREELRAQPGTEARGGDQVRTGWLGSATISEESRRARFEIYSASHVTLAAGTPGVLVALERGRLKALFDAFTGNEPRLVKTPGALLAVRGTRYGVEVGSDGRATLAVFEGTVEVRSELAQQPLLVNAGEVCRFGRHDAPRAMPMPRGMSEHAWERHGMNGGRNEGMSPKRGDDRMPSGAQGMPPGSSHGGKPHH